jgi:hypothetical protein
VRRLRIETIRTSRVESTSTNGRPRVESMLESVEVVPAEVAERLYQALTRLRDAASECGGTFSISHEHRAAYEAAEAALKFADGETP